tara:strand:- start:276 stop:482 length:207 start_codon:yes stop_codon:yes gene_type:complete
MVGEAAPKVYEFWKISFGGLLSPSYCFTFVIRGSLEYTTGNINFLMRSYGGLTDRSLVISLRLYGDDF